MGLGRQDGDKRAGLASDLRFLIDSVPALIHTALPDGYLDFFNQVWLDYVGRSLEDLRGWRWTEYIHPEDVEGILQKWRASLSSGEPFLHETRVRRADGEYRWMLHHKVAVRDARGNIVKWHGSSIDIEDRKHAEQALRLTSLDLQDSKAKLEEAQRITHVGYWEWELLTNRVNWSDETYRIYGLKPQERAMDLDTVREKIHPEDWEGVSRALEQALRGGVRYSAECRVFRPTGEARIVYTQGDVKRDDSGTPIAMFGTVQDITDRKRSEEALQQSQFYLAEGQRLAHMGSWAFDAGGFKYWSPELFRIYGLAPGDEPPSEERYLALVHPEDQESMKQALETMLAEHRAFDFTKRIVRPCGEIRSVRCVGVPVERGSIFQGYLGTGIDVTEQEQLTQELRRRQAYLADAQKLSHTGSFGWKPDTEEIVWSDETYRIFEYDPTVKPTINSISQRVHPEDRPEFQRVIDSAFAGAAHFEHVHRLLLPDGRIKYVHVLAHAVPDPSFNREFVGAVTDITEPKRAEEKIREQEAELRQILDLAPQLVAVYGPDRERLYANRVMLDYLGLNLEDWRHRLRFGDSLHPDDWETATGHFDRAVLNGVGFELELRLRKGDGSYRWFLIRCNPVWDDTRRITRWFLAATDIEDRKQAEESLRNENIALREEISKASMFEEIVGSSPALHVVLGRIAKVAPTASTVLITGETGTGKELVARAIHRRSQRCSRPFVSVNCAAVPRDLIASELFGHEKGAFTGALQRRIGKFELAEGGTLFLDEVGELTAETQIALLRVLQEREFERVGGNEAIRTDVRLIAATNRDLQSAIASGLFRSDLFYRLNVFPIDVPPLRARKDDIALLLEYFIDRFARQAGKKIKRIDKKTLELVQVYPWLGNIRELQNVVERSVVLCDSEIFSVDESWLSRNDSSLQPATLSKKPALEEKELIEAALAETRGRVSGPAGAAAKLGIPSTTLESKIKSLKINKYQFKVT